MTPEPLPLLLRRLQQLHRALEAAGFEHAVGGALALAVHVLESRATVDIDLNVIADPQRPRPLLDCLPAPIIRHTQAADELRQSGQTRLWWRDDDGIDTPVDLFLPQHPEFHQLVNDRAEPFLFGDVPIKVISATDLMVFKMLFNRRKDWADIESLIDAGTADVGEAAAWIRRFLGDDEPRLVQLRQIVEERAT
ncbi:MAG TPA: hypothetical protein PKV27_05865 [Ilumatobacteraceae bacterium]|nr:hypothetical protein [Ilumatobacteraceae bacterium]